jgi:hypothetical protein
MHRPIALPEPADSTDRIEAAESALATLDAAASAMSNLADLMRLSMRREAVASALIDGVDARLRDVLQLEATRQRDGSLPCAKAEANALHALRYFTTLENRVQRIGAERWPTAGELRDTFVHLLEDIQRSAAGWAVDTGAVAAPCPLSRTEVGEIPEGVESILACVAAELACARTLAEPVSAATAAHRRITSAAGTMPACAPLARTVFMLVMCANDRPWRALLAPSAAALRRECRLTWDAELVVQSVADTLALADRMATLSIADEDRIESLGKAAHSARRVHAALQRRPVMTLPQILDFTGLRVQPATSALHRLRALGIITEISGRHRNRVFGYDALIALLEHGLR